VIALEEWRTKKLEEAKKREAMKASVNSSREAKDTGMHFFYSAYV